MYAEKKLRLKSVCGMHAECMRTVFATRLMKARMPAQPEAATKVPSGVLPGPSGDRLGCSGGPLGVTGVPWGPFALHCSLCKYIQQWLDKYAK